MLLLLAILVPSVAATATAAAPFRVRLAARSDILPVGTLIERAFASNRIEDDTFASSAKRSWAESWFTAARISLDVERRMTPWDWCRHAQLIAEDSNSGELLGFCEVWAEDLESLSNVSALTPQPVLFNLCVSEAARRRGVAKELVEDCERRCLT